MEGIVTRVFFNHWKSTRRERREPTTPLHQQGTLRVLLYLDERQFKDPLEELWDSLKIAVCGDVGVYLTQSWAIASLQMPMAAIKTCSYCGACLRWRRLDNRPVRGWHWYDPGNYTYAVIWHMIRKAARHFSEHARHQAGQRCAARLLKTMLIAATRWSSITNGGPRGWEITGDLIELVLGRGYYCEELEFVIKAISKFACYADEIYVVIMTNVRPECTEPWISPEDFATALLMARSGHCTGCWHDFQVFVHRLQIGV